MYFPRRPVCNNASRTNNSIPRKKGLNSTSNTGSGWQSKMVAAAATLTALSSTGARFTAERARSFFPVAAAASVSGSTTAFMVPSLSVTPQHKRGPTATTTTMRSHPQLQEQVVWPPQRQRNPHVVFSPTAARPTLSTQRLYHSSPRGGGQRGGFNDDDESPVRGFLSKAKNVAKKFLPQKWFMNDEERRRAEQTKAIKKEVKGSLQQILKDAPLPIRLLGGAIAPLLSNLMNVAAETMAEQQGTVEAVLQQAQACLSADESVARALGGTTVTVGAPLSQASSSSSINGQTTVRVELALPVTAVGGAGTMGLQQQGVARVVATGDGKSEPTLQLLEVQVQGRVIPVSTTPRRGSSSSSRYSSSSSTTASKGDDDNIIEAEIIEEKRNRQ